MVSLINHLFSYGYANPNSVVQVKKIDDWSETGMQRYRYAWTSNKEDYWGLGSDGDYNSYSDISIDIRNAIKDSTGGCSSAERNLQGPWWSEDEQAYLTDMSEVQGAGGRSISNCVRDAAENNWMKTSGCSNEIVYAKGSH